MKRMKVQDAWANEDFVLHTNWRAYWMWTILTKPLDWYSKWLIRIGVLGGYIAVPLGVKCDKEETEEYKRITTYDPHSFMGASKNRDAVDQLYRMDTAIFNGMRYLIYGLLTALIILFLKALYL